MDYDEIERRRGNLTHKTFLMMFHIFWVVGLPAIGAYFGGRWLDTEYNMRPYGSFIASFIAMIISWTILIKMYKGITKEYRILREEEDREMDRRQKITQEKLGKKDQI